MQTTTGNKWDLNIQMYAEKQDYFWVVSAGQRINLQPTPDMKAVVNVCKS